MRAEKLIKQKHENNKYCLYKVENGIDSQFFLFPIKHNVYQDPHNSAWCIQTVTGKNLTATFVDTELYYSFNLQHTQRNSL